MKGLNTEIPDGMELQALTIAVLHNVEKEGVCELQHDDSPDSHEAVEQLEKISGYVGYLFIKRSEYVILVVGEVPTVRS